MNIYLAGPMRGHHLYNLHEFARGALLLRSMGHNVFNPIERDLANHGFDPSLDLEDQDFDLKEAMRRDLQYIVSQECDAVVLLPEWGDSKGAQVEVLAAFHAGKRLFLLNGMKEFTLDSFSIDMGGLKLQ